MTELGKVPISDGDEIQDVAAIALLEKVLPLVPIITYGTATPNSCDTRRASSSRSLALAKSRNTDAKRSRMRELSWVGSSLCP